MKITVNDHTIEVFKDGYTIKNQFVELHSSKELLSYLLLKDESRLYFKDLSKIEHRTLNNALYGGIITDYQNDAFHIRTACLLDKTTSEIVFKLNVLKSNGLIEKIFWPEPLSIDDGYAVIPFRQGLIIPNDDTRELKMSFNGQFYSTDAYLSMLGYVYQKGTVLMIAETPADSGYYKGSENGHNRFGFYHLPSLGSYEKERSLRYIIGAEGDYNTIAKAYRSYLKERGLFKSLKEKAIALPDIYKLARSAFVHTGIKTKVCEDSSFYDPNDPGKNDHLTTFKDKLKEIKQIAKTGIKDVYIHLDGWGVAYDNAHPDPFPIAMDAGGERGFKALVDGIHDLGYLFGIHDQYRDFYFHSKSYDASLAVESADGSHFAHNRWAGGWQNYLCASFAKDFVKRNFTRLHDLGIKLDCAYLDVFTCNEMDECFNEDHPMTRLECKNYREDTFKYLIDKQIIPSSEEVNEWAMNTLVFCHYAPYEFMMHEDGRFIGKAIPLFNLVYHDAVLIPWMMDKRDDDYMLYALLNGGLPYLRRDSAYPNIDGSFEGHKFTLNEALKRSKEVLKLADKVIFDEMIAHHFLNDACRKQETIFDNGIKVTIDLDRNTYNITKIK